MSLGIEAPAWPVCKILASARKHAVTDSAEIVGDVHFVVKLFAEVGDPAARCALL
jgi:hypothetical protein